MSVSRILRFHVDPIFQVFNSVKPQRKGFAFSIFRAGAPKPVSRPAIAGSATYI